MVAQVGEGAGNPHIDNGNTNELPHKGKITLTMQEFKFREGVSSESLRKAFKNNSLENSLVSLSR